MKKFFGFLVHLFIILLELAICAFLMFYLVSRLTLPPQDDGPTPTPRSPVPTPTPIPTLAPWAELKGTDTLTSAPFSKKLNIPSVFWIPEQLAPEKQWGYDRVYSCTNLERIPGFWHILGSQPPISPYFPMYIFDECTMQYF